MTLGQRLKEERKRLNFTQKIIAQLIEIHYTSWVYYEKDNVNPTSIFFEKIAPYGFDVQYILTGVRSDTALSPDERELLTLYKEAPETIKQAVKAVLLSGGVATVKSVDFGKNNKIQNSNIKIS